MRFLAILLLAPWLFILGWTYWAYPKSLPRSLPRRAFDALALFAAASTAVWAALHAFALIHSAAVSPYDDRPPSGAIWQQVLPALAGYGGFSGVVLLALFLRWLIWRRRGHH